MPYCSRLFGKVIACGLLLIAPAGFARAQEAKPAARPAIHSSLEAAYEAAAADQSLVLLVFSADWCQPCQLLKKTTLDVPDFLDHAGLLHIIDIDVDANEKTAAAFSVSSIPALVLLTGDRKIVARQTGYLDPAQLLAWLEEGRHRMAQGQWEGAAPANALAPFERKASGEGLDAADIAKLLVMLEDPDPAGRAAVSKLIVSQRELSVPPLLDGMTNSYLGVRIAASEILHKLAPDTAVFDPWQSPADLQGSVEALRKWWAGAGRLPPLSKQGPIDPTLKGSIEAALRQLRGEDPSKRTEAMSTLVNHGESALPAVREAIKRADRDGDHRAVALLEDVRWAILIPESLEHQVGGTRLALARGTSLEQQGAVTRLGNAGHEALPALVELANGADPLVVEKVMRVLSDIGGKDAIPAMAALLKSGDSNLRMTAAQALGHTKDHDANAQLITAVDDVDEVVACAAVAGLEEVNGNQGYSSSGKNQPREVVEALKRCLADTRWRVRAAAAEASGKMHINELVGDLKKLLDDPDGFVVKTSLTALRAMSAQPDVTQLAALSVRLPSLRADAVEMMAQSKSPEVANTVSGIFDQSGTAEKVSILTAISRWSSSSDADSDDTWKPLLTRAATAAEPRIRCAAAKALEVCSKESAIELVGPLLGDDDVETRAAAAEALLNILSHDEKGSRGRNSMLEGSILVGGQAAQEATKKSTVPADKLALWHAALLRHRDPNPDLMVALAIFLTGDGKSDLALLSPAFQKSDAKSMRRVEETAVMKLVLQRLPWPEGKAVLEGLSSAPGLYVLVISLADQVPPGIAEYMLEPARFRAALESLSGSDLAGALQMLLLNPSSYGQKQWTLLSEGTRADSILTLLVNSTNSVWRAAAVFALGSKNAEKNLAILDAATRDTNPWVRVAGVQGLARAMRSDRPGLETRLGVLLADTNTHVAQIVAMALLEPEVRFAASLQWQFSAFEFEDIHVQSFYQYSNEERPLVPLEGKPAFLADARRRLSEADAETSGIFALLLAQYGEFDGLDQLAPKLTAIHPREYIDPSKELLASIALSHDAKYVPILSKLALTQKEQGELTMILQAARGMSGPEVRQLRLDINKQIRKFGENTIE